jgi:phage terminase large subunit-like protein
MLAESSLGGVWGIKGADRYLLDQVRDRLGFPETVAAIKKMTLKWPKASLKLVEDKANGPAVLSALRHEVTGLVAISCNVYLPHPAIAPWVESFIDECNSFPNGKFDDQVDQMTQALNRLRGMGDEPPQAPQPPPPPGNEYSWMG